MANLEITGSVNFKHLKIQDNYQTPGYSTYTIHRITYPQGWKNFLPIYDLDSPIHFPPEFRASMNNGLLCLLGLLTSLVQYLLPPKL